MEFCPKCGSVLIQKRKNYGCARCNYSSKDKVKITISEKIGGREEIGVVKKEISIHPIISEKCKKCKNDKAYFWTVQLRAADEAEVKFFKCTKCAHAWKEYR